MNAKNQMLRIASLATLLASGAWAQLTHPITADVPFDFTVGKSTFNAGKYQVQTSMPGVLRVTSTDGKSSAMLIISPKRQAKTEQETKLVFNRYGTQYFLSEVWSAGTDTGIELRKSPAEREMAKRLVKPDDMRVVAGKR